MTDYIYDIECYPNCFLLTAANVDERKMKTFEISSRVDQRNELLSFMRSIYKDRMVGFNNLFYDYPLLHVLLNDKMMTNGDLWKKSNEIINATKAPFIKPLIRQLDLFKVNHFDNDAKRTSLKVLEFNMRMDSIEELPFPVGSVLTNDQIDVLRDYNKHDVKATFEFYNQCLDAIKFREYLSNKFKRNFMNHNDVKIGKDFFVMSLEKQGISCYENKEPRQTPRKQIVVKDILLPYISFKHPELQRVHEEFKNLVITNTKGNFSLSADLDGFVLDYGTGGLHGSLLSTMVKADEEYAIENRDVASYYPNLAIKNRFYPEHLTERFCDVYESIYNQRKKYPKGSAENSMMKLALNGTYGASNSEYSPFYDPQFTMAITINGQLLLSMLVEMMLEVPTVEMVNVNTDGLCYKVARKHLDDVESVAQKWQNLTKLELEKEYIKRMYLRDVNSYILEFEENED